MADDVTRRAQFLGNLRIAFDFVEESSGGVFQESGNQVESTTMWHAENDMFNTVCSLPV